MCIDFDLNSQVELPSLDDCPWWGVSELRRPFWARLDCGGRMVESVSGLVCERHHNAVRF